MKLFVTLFICFSFCNCFSQSVKKEYFLSDIEKGVCNNEVNISGITDWALNVEKLDYSEGHAKVISSGVFEIENVEGEIILYINDIILCNNSDFKIDFKLKDISRVKPIDREFSYSSRAYSTNEYCHNIEEKYTNYNFKIEYRFHSLQLFMKVIIQNITNDNCLQIQDFIVTGIKDKEKPKAKYGEIVINELMVDPTPAILKSESEYIEIYNTSNVDLSLDSLLFIYKGKVKDTIFEQTIKVGEYKLLSSAKSLIDLEQYGEVIPTKGFVLANRGAKIELRYVDHSILDTLTYDINWNDKKKKSGGYSLERKDYLEPNERANWSSCESSRGGTPGKINSVSSENPLNVEVKILKIEVEDKNVLLVEFDNNMNIESLKDISKYSLTGIKNSVSEVSVIDESNIKISFSESFVFGERLNLHIENVQNSFKRACSMDMEFCCWEDPIKGDVFINEILFNPYDGGTDFIELYNKSLKKIDISSILIKTGNGLIPLDVESKVFLPETYIVVSVDKNKIINFYSNSDEKNLFDLPEMPLLNSKSGSIVLRNVFDEQMDSVYYDETMHKKELIGVKGVSLERVSCDVKSDVISNWSSAKSDVGYASPGVKNSLSVVEHKKDLRAKYGEIVINELMVDPTPEKLDSKSEYIELYNSSKKDLSLDSLLFIYKGKVKDTIFNQNIKAGEYRLLSSTKSLIDLEQYGEVIPINGLRLANLGSDIKLQYCNVELLDSITYDISWNDKSKKDGGWSLERINASKPNNKDNWSSCIFLDGGTPGKINSVSPNNPIKRKVQIVSIRVEGMYILNVEFDTDMDIESLKSTSKYRLENSDNYANKILECDKRHVKLRFGKQFKSGDSDNLHISDVKTIYGVKSSMDKNFYYLIPPMKGDLIINEVLFNSCMDGVDFIELYNKSVKEIDLSDLYLVINEVVNNKIQISKKSRVVKPEEYIVLSVDKERVMSIYFEHDESCFVNVENMPDLNDKSGVISIISNFGEIIDKFSYAESMHSKNIVEYRGISLERRSFILETNNKINWSSASKEKGNATPGVVNSLKDKEAEGKIEVKIKNKTFNPFLVTKDNCLIFTIDPKDEEYFLDIDIYNERGVLSRSLLKGEFINHKIEYSWDGIRDNGYMAAVGIYIILIELTDEDGNMIIKKEICVLSH